MLRVFLQHRCAPSSQEISANAGPTSVSFRGVNALCVLPDGRLASGCDDNTIRLWDVASGAVTARLEGHSNEVATLCGLPDGRLASGSLDNTIRLWDVARGADREKARQGKALFMTYCASCHNAYPYTWTAPNKYGKRFIQVGLVPQKYVGTDAAQFQRTQPYAITGSLSAFMPPPYKDQAIIPTPEFREVLTFESLRRALEALKLSDAERLDYNGYRELPPPPAPVDSWKAAPRDGVWATGPFLHNGSVPNLYEMLIPASQRTKKFYVGREFDPVKVGIDTSGKSGNFLFDASLIGNSNAGHSFENGPRGNGIIGPLLTEQQRWALVEYLKSIPEEAGRVTRYGGPPNARTGNQPWANPRGLKDDIGER